MRSAIVCALLCVILSLGNFPRLIFAGPLKSAEITSLRGSTAGEKYDDNDNEEPVAEWIIDVVDKPGVTLPLKSSWAMLPVHNFFWFYCGTGRRRDANGRCRTVIYRR